MNPLRVWLRQLIQITIYLCSLPELPVLLHNNMSVQRSPPREIVGGSQPDLSRIQQLDEININFNSRKRKTPECHCDNQESQLFSQNSLMDMLKSTLDKQSLEMKNIVDSLRHDLTSFKQDMRDLAQSIHKISEEQTQIKNDINELKSSTLTQSQKIDAIDKQATQLSTTVGELSEQQLIKEQQGRINNLEISGIPVLKGENLMNTLNTIAAKIGFSLLPYDVDYIHRVRRFTPKKNNDIGDDSQTSPSIPNIIVRFTQRRRKNEMLAAVRARRGLTTADAGFNGPSKPIFINDHLTPQNKLLYKQARLIAKEKNYKYVWLSECKILLRKNDASKVLLVSNENDLSKIK